MHAIQHLPAGSDSLPRKRDRNGLIAYARKVKAQMTLPHPSTPSNPSSEHEAYRRSTSTSAYDEWLVDAAIHVRHGVSLEGRELVAGKVRPQGHRYLQQVGTVCGRTKSQMVPLDVRQCLCTTRISSGALAPSFPSLVSFYSLKLQDLLPGPAIWVPRQAHIRADNIPDPSFHGLLECIPHHPGTKMNHVFGWALAVRAVCSMWSKRSALQGISLQLNLGVCSRSLAEVAWAAFIHVQ
eukprot:1160193-Pelagomonas_calceolata.AAC.5